MNRKKLAALLLAAALAVTLAACSGPGTEKNAAQQQGAVDADASASIKGPAVPAVPSSGQGRVAVVYFSEPGAAQKHEVQGTTQYVAQAIQEKTGADIYRIERSIDYPTNYDTLTGQAKEEKDDNARPALKDTIGDLSQYDTIFLGYPIWWYDAPMPV